MKKEPGSRTSGKPFPWVLLLLLLASLYFFWILPFQLGKRPVEVEFQRIPQAPAAGREPSDSP